MSGICCLIDFSGAPANAGALCAMAESVAYRGPDGIRCLTSGQAALAFLALDTAPEAFGERQPVANLEAGVRLVADARLDNRDELVASLASSIATDLPNDAELIMAAYLRWGLGCLEHLLGDFAFALWDAREGRLLCARDPLGVKALHYAHFGDLLLVGSEAQQILHYPAFPRRLDELTVGEFLTDAVRDSDHTFFRDVRCLMPAHRLVATAKGVRLERYWDVDPQRRTLYRRDEEYAEHFRELLRRAVVDRLRAPDATVGISMSGGLDSTSVAALAHQHIAGAGGPRLVAVSYVFDHLERCDERRYIRAMADELGIEVEYIDAERFWILKDPVAHEPSLEMPLLNWDGVQKEAFERLRGQGARVMLSGHGGDLIAWSTPLACLDRLRAAEPRVLLDIARYAWALRGPRLWHALNRHLYQPIATRLRARLQFEQRSLTESALQASSWISPDLFRRIGSIARPEAGWVPRRFREAARQKHYEALYLLAADGRGVYWMDCCSSRYGFEVRHPFLDRRLVEFVLSIPPHQLFRPGSHKSLIRRAMTGILPDLVRNRSDKSSVEAFLHWSLREKEVQQIERLLASPLCAEVGLVDGDRLRAAYQRFRAGPWAGPVQPLWRCIQLELWIRKHHEFLGC